jgi:DNA-binding CsgD family transcriptional regulator
MEACRSSMRHDAAGERNASLAASPLAFTGEVPLVILELTSWNPGNMPVGEAPASTLSQRDVHATLMQTGISVLANSSAGIAPNDPCVEVSITVIRATRTTGGPPAVMEVHSDGWVIGTRAPEVVASPEPPVTDARLAEGTTTSHSVAPRVGLSPREREVLALVAQGQSNKEIADSLFVAPSTIKTHVTSLLTKLDACSRAHLATIAARDGLLPD